MRVVAPATAYQTTTPYNMKAKFTFQVESTLFDATPDEVNRIVPKWANDKKKSLKVLVYIGRKWRVYKVFNPAEVA